MHFDDATHDDAAISRQELLERAAELGPARLTYASILLPTDPVLSRKMQPSVAERRARLRGAVKIALGACVAFCVFAATRASAGSSEPVAAAVHGAPAAAVVPIEKLEQASVTKAAHAGQVTAAHAGAAPARWKRK